MAALEMKGTLTGVAKDMLAKDDKLILTFRVDPDETEYLGYFRQGENLRISVNQWFPKRSVSVNNLFWACVREIAQKLRHSEEEVYLDLIRNYGVSQRLLVPGEDAVEQLKGMWKMVEKKGEVSIGGKLYTEVACFYGSSSYTSDQFARLMDGVLEEMKNCEIIPPSKADIVNSLAVWKQMNNGDSSCDECRGNVDDEPGIKEEKPKRGRKAKEAEKVESAAAAPEPVVVPAEEAADEVPFDTATEDDAFPVETETASEEPAAEEMDLPVGVSVATIEFDEVPVEVETSAAPAVEVPMTPVSEGKKPMLRRKVV